MHVTLHQLKVFEAVARCRSFTRASEALHLTQPTVSAQVRQLTEAVGQPLFDQVGKRIFLTEAGEALYATCREMFDAWERFEMAAEDLKGLKRGRLKLATVTTAEYFIPDLLAPFCATHPGVEVGLTVANRDTILDRLRDHQDDLYIMGMPPEGLELVVQPFLENPLVILAPQSHPLAGQTAIAPRRLTAEGWILREPGSGTRMAFEQAMLAQGIPVNAKLVLGSNEAVKHAVAAGLGLAVVSQHALAPLPPNTVILDVTGFPLHRSWSVVYPADKRLSVVAAAFLKHLVRPEQEVLPSSTM